MIGFMVKTRMCNNLVHKYSDQDKNIIFDSQQRVVSNMLISQEYDVDYLVTNLLAEKP
jgi:hypothetical protein